MASLDRLLSRALLLPCNEADEIFHHVYREENVAADKLADAAHLENLSPIRVTTLERNCCPFGVKLLCSFDGSLRGQYGAGGWDVYMERSHDGWACVATASFPINGATSSTATEIVAAMSLLRFLEVWIAQGLSISTIPQAMLEERSHYDFSLGL